MHHSSFSVADDNRDHVESNLNRAGAPFLHPLDGQTPEPRLLPVVDGLTGISPPIGSPGLDFTEDQDLAVGAYEIDLSGLAAEVPLEHEVTGALHEIGGEIFSQASKFGSWIHGERP